MEEETLANSVQKLAKGSLVLGQISRINNLDIEVALPNNLIGHISIVAISEQLTQRLQAAADQDEKDDEDDEDEDEKSGDVDLRTLFAVGQYLRVYVVSTMDESAGVKGRRKIELSIRPTEANEGLGKDEMVPNATVMASVVSVEDHGCVMDTGIANLRAFVPKAEIDPSVGEERLQPGAVHLCSVIKGSSSKVVQLSLLQKRLGSSKSAPSEATTINTFLPGTIAEVLITNTDRRGLSGKILGSLDVTADVVHSGAGPSNTDLDATYKIGSKVKARVICNFPTAKEPKLGISLLPHLTALESKRPGKSDSKKLPTEVLPISSLVEKCTVRHVEAEIGLFVDIGIPGLSGFVHISRVKDGKVDALYESSGPYKVDSVHRGRVVGYNEVDGLFQLSFEKSILEQQYIRLEDVPIGAVVNCEVEKVVVGENGVTGLIVKVADSVKGFVPEIHLSDVRLQNPEKKFREGVKVKARVLSVEPSKNRMRLTMKKTLVNSEAPVVKSYDDASIGMQVPGTIIKLQDNGALVRFYGRVKGFLPVSEMSEAYIRDPTEHFRIGQVVSVHVLDVDEESNRLIVSCKDPAAFGLEKQNALKKLQLGDPVEATVTEKTEDHIHVELVGSELKALLPVGQLTDKSLSKNQHAAKRIHAGQKLSDLVVIDKNENRRAIILSQKPSLVAAAKNKSLLSSFDDAKEGAVVAGFVRNITQTAIFVQFAGNLHALLPKARLPAEALTKPDFGFHKSQSIEVRIVSLIKDLRRIMVAPSSEDAQETPKPTKAEKPAPSDNLSFGSTVRVKINSIKETQMNVQIVDSSVQGRIDVSQVFDSWDEIDNPKEPLSKFHKQQVIRAKVIGVHDAKDHKFLPFSHRSAHSVLELTVKRSEVKADDFEPLTLDKVKTGDSHIAFVNNVTPQFLWVNLSPNVRGRISAMDASDDVSLLGDLAANFPAGSAIKAKVTAVNSQNNRLDLSARSAGASPPASWASLRKNMVLAGKVTKVNERQILVQLSDLVSGPVHLPDMTDNFDDGNTLKYKKNDIVRVSVVEVDASNKRLRLSTRPSRIMSSTLPVADKEITEFSQVSPGDVIRGFVKNVSDKGLFVLLGGQVSGLVKIANLSDRFLKNWKDEFQVDQLVKGRVLSVDAAARQLELSLKSSMVDENYVPLTTFAELREGQVVTGKVRKVEDFGAFILIDNSANLSGLCHRSQMADKPVQDATKLYKEGDVVKAVITKLDAEKKRISFSLKSSLFDDDTDMESDSEAGAALEEESDDDEDEDVEMGDGGAMLKIIGTDNVDDSDEDEDDDDDDLSVDDSDEDGATKKSGLAVGKKSAWSADPFAQSEDEDEDDEPAPADEKTKKKRKKHEIQVDRTAELDVKGPQTASDYERFLLGQPDSSELWIAYMASQMQVSDLSKAREVAERAIKTINIREETEKLNVWVAYLNLEVAYGNKQTVEEVLERACQYNDAQEVYERLASIYIQSEKLEVSRRANDDSSNYANRAQDADKLFEEKLLKKFGAQTPTVWTNYAHFLHATKNEPQRARALLPRATQQLGDKHSQTLISRFAALEFRSPNGEPEHGRTLFAKLLDVYPKKGDLWGQLVDLEMGVAEQDGGDADAVRDVFERRTKVKGLKPQQAEKWFRRWAAWEEKKDGKGKERVMAKAQDWAASFKAKKAAAAAEDEEMEE